MLFRSWGLATEAAESGTCDYHPASNERRWDVRCKQRFGLSPEAAVTYAGSFIAGIHPDDRERADEAVRRAIDPEGTGRYDIEYRTIGIEDGRPRWISASGSALFDADQGQRFVGTVIAITERSATEEMRSEERHGR